MQRETEVCSGLLDYLTQKVRDTFRDPGYFRARRERVLAHLRTYPSLKIWVAGCSTGEEVYSQAVLLQKAGRLERTLIYATDINLKALQAAGAGVFEDFALPQRIDRKKSLA